MRVLVFLSRGVEYLVRTFAAGPSTPHVVSGFRPLACSFSFSGLSARSQIGQVKLRAGVVPGPECGLLILAAAKLIQPVEP